MTLKVGPHRYEVHAARDINNGSLSGQCDSIAGRILIDIDFFKSSQRSTLFHEAIHAVDHVYGIGLTEEQVRSLEVGLLTMIDENPDLLKFKGA